MVEQPAEQPLPYGVRVIEIAINGMGRAISWLGLLMVLITTLLVVLRYVVGFGSVAAQELVVYMHATLFMLGASYALLHDAHVRVDVFYRAWSPRFQAGVDLVGTILLLVPFCIFSIVVSYSYVIASWRLYEASPEAGGLPLVFVLKTLILLMPILLLAAGLVRMMRCALILRFGPEGERS